MSQYMVAGMMFGKPDYLQHGLGIGSGRGRPVGSKNGKKMPGAAFMKNYKIKGEIAEEEEAKPITQGPARSREEVRRAYQNSSAGKELQTAGRAALSRVANNSTTYSRTGMTQLPSGREAVRMLRAEADTANARSRTDSQGQNQSKTGAVLQEANLTNTLGNAVLGTPTNLESTYTVDGVEYSRPLKQFEGAPEGATMQTTERRGGLFGKGGVVERVSSAVSSLASRAANTIGTAANSVKDWFSKAFGTVSRAVSGAAQAAGRWVGDRATDVGNAILGRQVEDVVSDPDGPDMPAGTYHREGGLFGRGGVAERVGNAVGGAVKAAGSWIQNAAGTAVSAIRGAASQASGFASRVVQSVGSTANRVKTAVENFVLGTPTNLEPTYTVDGVESSRPLKQFEGAPDGATMQTTERRGGLFGRGGLADQIDGAAQNAWQAVSAVPDNISRFAGTTAQNVGNAISSGYHTVDEWAKNASNDISRYVGNTRDNVEQGLTDFGTWVGDRAADVRNAVNATGQWFGDTARNIGNAAQATGQWFGDTARNVGGAVAGMYDQYIGQPIARNQRAAANNAAMPVGSEAYRNAFNTLVNTARTSGVGSNLTDQELANIINQELIYRAVPDLSSRAVWSGLNDYIMNQISAAQAAREQAARNQKDYDAMNEFKRQHGLR